MFFLNAVQQIHAFYFLTTYDGEVFGSINCERQPFSKCEPKASAGVQCDRLVLTGSCQGPGFSDTK